MKQKSHNLIFSSFFLLGAIVLCSYGETGAAKEIESLFTELIIAPGWHSPEWKAEGTVIISGEKAGSENRMLVFSRWNNDSLYFFFKVHDSCLRACQTEKDHPKLFLDDMVEVLIDTQNDKDNCWAEDDIVYHVNLLEVKKDDRGTHDCLTDPVWDGNARISAYLLGTANQTIDVDTGYMMALSIPWTELKQKGKPGLTMGINFANGDNDGKGRQLFDWVGAWPMRSPYAYGNLILIKNDSNENE